MVSHEKEFRENYLQANLLGSCYETVSNLFFVSAFLCPHFRLMFSLLFFKVCVLVVCLFLVYDCEFFCSDGCVTHIVYAHFPIHNLSNSLCLFGALCAHRTIPGVFAHGTTLVSCVFNAECTNTSFSVYCKLPQSLGLFLSDEFYPIFRFYPIFNM